MENDCQSCNRNKYTRNPGASSVDECVCIGEFDVDCCGICFSLDCIPSFVFFDFEGSISANEESTNQSFIFAQHGSVDYSVCVPSGDISNNCSRVTSYNALKDTKFSLSKTIFSDHHVIMNYGLGSFYEMNTPGFAVSLWIMYDDDGPGNGHIFLQSGNFSVSHPPLSSEVHIGGVIVDAEMYTWHNVFVSLDRRKCLDVWFNSKHVCKCCSKTEFMDTNNNIELLGHIESKGVYVDDLRIYNEAIYFQEKCDLDMMCGAGNETLDAHTCTQCAPGKHKKGAYGNCEYCTEGTYSSVLGMSSCTNCPANMYSPPNSASVSSCLCNAGYSNADSDSCVECVIGKYKEDVGNSVCVDCKSNTYSRESGSETCDNCPMNTNSISGSYSKMNCICNPGTTGQDGEPCVECVPGKYKTHSGNTSCTSCESGKYSMYASASNSSMCLECPHSTTSMEASNNAMQCMCIAGTTKSYEGHCVSCISGSYKNETSNSACTNCATGTFSTITGAITRSVCQQFPDKTMSVEGSNNVKSCTCNIGTTGPDGGSCVDCISGKYKDVIGSSSCVYCEVGKYANGLNGCEQCPDKTMSVEGSNHITNCKCNIGTTGPDGGSCITCIPGKYKNTSGDIECVKCESGKYSTISGATTSTMCIPCVQDSNSSEGSNNMKDCLCVIGTTGPDGGPCINCLPGEYKHISGNMSCTKCVVGKYFDVHHTAPDNVCKQCPENSTSLEGSINQLQCICEEGTDGPQGGPCKVIYNEILLVQDNNTNTSQTAIDLYSTPTSTIQSTPTSAISLESTPSSAISIQYTPTSAISIQSTPTSAISIQLTPTSAISIQSTPTSAIQSTPTSAIQSTPTSTIQSTPELSGT